MSITSTQDIQWEVLPGAPLILTQDLSWVINSTADTISSSLILNWSLGQDVTNTTVVLLGAPTGLAGIITVSLVSYDGTTVVYYPTTDGIQEVPADTGRYIATVPTPDVGDYFVVWATTTMSRYGTMSVEEPTRWGLTRDLTDAHW